MSSKNINKINSNNSLGGYNYFDSSNCSKRRTKSLEKTQQIRKVPTIFETKIEIKESLIERTYDQQGQKYYNGYKVLEKLGEGAFSKVKLIEKNNEKFACKVINKKALAKKNTAANFAFGNVKDNTLIENALKEIAILKKTNHPNILKLYEIIYDNDKDKIYLVLEYCPNGELIEFDSFNDKFYINKNFIPKGQRKEDAYYSEKDIKRFITDIVSGLRYLHLNGIIHRDIKPNNILLDKNNKCKITDFNVSSILQDKLNDDVGKKIEATDQFRAPETCFTLDEVNNESEEESDEDSSDDGPNPFLPVTESKNKPPKEKKVESKKQAKPNYKGKPLDIWALGVTAYAIAYRKLPFQGENDFGILQLFDRIARVDYSIPATPVYSDEFKDFIRRCLEKDFDKRITADEIMNLNWIRKGLKQKFVNLVKKEFKIVVSKNELMGSLKFFPVDFKDIFKFWKAKRQSSNIKLEASLYKFLRKTLKKAPKTRIENQKFICNTNTIKDFVLKDLQTINKENILVENRLKTVGIKFSF